MSEQAPETFPSPLPTHFNLSQVNGPTGNMVMIETHDAGGVKITFLPPKTAVIIGRALIQLGQGASTGLIVVEGDVG